MPEDTKAQTNHEARKNVLPGSDLTGDLLKLAHVALVALPVEGLKRITVGGNDRELGAVGWKTYDAVVGVANAATNRIYSNESFGRFAGRAIDLTLQWQRLNLALTGAFFSTLWPALGVPAASDVHAMREELHALREEVRAARFEQTHHEERAQLESDRIESDQIDSDSIRPGAAEPLRVAATTGLFQKPMWERWTRESAEVKVNVSN
ncbi:MAG TPA: hypothetical protein VIX59_12350 [Candidatus Binataceae bacterium]